MWCCVMLDISLFFVFPAIERSIITWSELYFHPFKGNVSLSLLRLFEYNLSSLWCAGGREKRATVWLRGKWSNQRGEDYPRPGKKQKSAVSFSGWHPWPTACPGTWQDFRKKKIVPNFSAKHYLEVRSPLTSEIQFGQWAHKWQSFGTKTGEFFFLI